MLRGVVIKNSKHSCIPCNVIDISYDDIYYFAGNWGKTHLMIYITVNLIYVADILSLCVSAKHEDFYDCDSATVDVHPSRSAVFVSLYLIRHLDPV